MQRTPHDGQDHSQLMPRRDEEESWPRLDELPADLARLGGRQRVDLVAAHAGSLFAGIEFAPGLESWLFGLGATEPSARWLELVLGVEIDRTVLRLAESPTGCVDCLMARVRIRPAGRRIRPA